MSELSLIEREAAKKRGFMPWGLTKPEVPKEQATYQAMLRDEKGVVIGEDTFISEEALVTEGVAIGSRTTISAGCIVRGEVKIGDNSTLNAYSQISGKVSIGSGVRIASLVSIYGENHGFDDVNKPLTRQRHTRIGIVIEDDVWIGANVAILDGVTIHSHSVIGAGAVVTRDVPPYSIVGGNPAKVIRDRRIPRGTTKNALIPRLQAFGEQVAREWPRVLENQLAEGDGERIYRDSQYGEPTQRACCDAVEIAAMFDAVPVSHSKDEFVETLQGFQFPGTGFYEEKPKDLSASLLGGNTYMYLAAGYALETLGSHPKHPIKALDTLGLEKLYGKLESLPWKDWAWGCGDWVDTMATAMYHHRKYHCPGYDISPLFGWLHTHVNRLTGLWGEPKLADGWLQPVNGFYRLTRGTYAQFGLPLPYPVEAVDTVLAHIRQMQGFASRGVTACNLLDVVHPLWLCRQQTAHREGEAKAFIESQIEAILPRWVSDRGFAFNQKLEPGLQGTEMWLSILYIASDYLGLAAHLGYRPKGIHRLTPALQLGGNWV